MRIELTTRTALLALTALTARGALAVPPAEDCAAILARSSTEWANGCAVKEGGSEEASTEALENALARYGECYDAATDALAKRLAGADHETARRAERCLPALEAALDGFTEYALGAALNQGTYSRTATAYATLYAKQFRRLAYEASSPQPTQRDAEADPRLTAARSRLAEILASAPTRLREDLSERFATFRDAAKGCGIGPARVYEFAIYALQSPADPAFAPPPF